jgi:dTDP-4-amino-4,6-dideoxygalactose transaminase
LNELAAILPGRSAGDIRAFEAAFAAQMGQRYAVSFPYGRTGLLLLLRALGIRGATVVCPAYTCVVVQHAIVLSGNKPVFVDSGRDANMDLDLAEAAIRPDTRALIATSIFGHPVDIDRLAGLQERHPDLIAIQDCAHSFIAEWKGKPVHRAGKAALFAMNASKMMTSIFGGMVTTDDGDLASQLVAERDREIIAPAFAKSVARALYVMALYPAFWPPLYGLTERLRQSGLLDRFTRYYSEDAIDMPSDYLIGMTDIEARIGLAQLPRLEGFVSGRRAYADYYRQHLSDLPALSWIHAPPGSSFSHIAARVARKSNVMADAFARGIQLGEIIEYSVPEMKAYREMSAGQGPFPVSGQLARQTINLPVFGKYDVRLAEKVVRVMREILKGELHAGELS